MQHLCEESFSVVEPLLADDYKRLRSRLALVLGPADSEIFAPIDVLPNRGKWMTDAPAPLSPYSAASPLEKEQIAAYIEDARARLLPRLSEKVPQAETLFRVPDESCLYWYKDPAGQIRVVMAQWGFRRSNTPGDVDVIEFLLAQPRPLSMVNVTIEVAWMWGAPVADCEMQLEIFNNTRTFTTDADGRYYIGPVKAGISFRVTDLKRGKVYDFTVESGREIYRIELMKLVEYSLTVVDRNLKPMAGYNVSINGCDFVTDAEGKISEKGYVYNPGDRLTVLALPGEEMVYTLDPDGKNEFVYQVNLPEEKVEEVLPPVEEPRPVRIRVLDIDGSPLDGVEVFIDQPGGVTLSAVSDKDGVAVFPRDTFVDKKKSKVRFTLSPEYQRMREERKKQAGNNGK